MPVGKRQKARKDQCGGENKPRITTAIAPIVAEIDGARKKAEYPRSTGGGLKVVAWEIVFEPSGRPGQQDSCICFTKFETSMQVKKFIESGVAIHEIRKDGKTHFDAAQVAKKFGRTAAPAS